jgi:galactose mutarotase-like enzyme
MSASARKSTFEGFDSLELVAGRTQATFVPGLGMIGASLLHDGEELLDRQRGLEVYRDTGAVLGLPLLHPWANRLGADEYEVGGRHVVLPPGPPIHREEHDLPIHGVMSDGWRVDALDAGGDAATAQASLDFDAGVFPFAHRISLAARLAGDALSVTTTVTPTGEAAVPVSFGFHPYLRLPGADRGEWRISLPRRRHLVLDDRMLPTGEGTDEAAETFALADRTYDDGYDGIAPGAAFSASAGGRTITVTFDAGYPVAQIYSPPGGQFICFEPMTAPVDALRTGEGLRLVEPGGSFTARFTIAVERQPGGQAPLID